MTAQWTAESRYFALIASSAGLRQNPRVPCKSRDFFSSWDTRFGLGLWWAACPRANVDFVAFMGHAAVFGIVKFFLQHSNQYFTALLPTASSFDFANQLTMWRQGFCFVSVGRCYVWDVFSCKLVFEPDSMVLVGNGVENEYQSEKRVPTCADRRSLD
jgi:hypothetical protein